MSSRNEILQLDDRSTTSYRNEEQQIRTLETSLLSLSLFVFFILPSFFLFFFSSPSLPLPPSLFLARAKNFSMHITYLVARRDLLIIFAFEKYIASIQPQRRALKRILVVRVARRQGDWTVARVNYENCWKL